MCVCVCVCVCVLYTDLALHFEELSNGGAMGATTRHFASLPVVSLLKIGCLKKCFSMRVSIHGGNSWMVYVSKSSKNWWFRGTIPPWPQGRFKIAKSPRADDPRVADDLKTFSVAAVPCKHKTPQDQLVMVRAAVNGIDPCFLKWRDLNLSGILNDLNDVSWNQWFGGRPTLRQAQIQETWERSDQGVLSAKWLDGAP